MTVLEHLARIQEVFFRRFKVDLSGGVRFMTQKVAGKKKVQSAASSKKSAKKRRAVKSARKTKKTTEKATPATQPVITELILDHRENGRKLARSILRKWRVRMPAEEIDSIVDLTLCEAAKRYSPEKGASFMTFLFYHLRGQLVRAVTSAAQQNSIFLACAQSAGIDTSEWYRAENGDSWDSVPDYLEPDHLENDTPEQSILKQEQLKKCSEACNRLDDLEREVIIRSFHKEEALVDIAKDLGYSRCHISRVKKSSLTRLKAIMEADLHKQDADNNQPHRENHLITRASASLGALATLGKRRARRRRIKASDTSESKVA